MSVSPFQSATSPGADGRRAPQNAPRLGPSAATLSSHAAAPEHLSGLRGDRHPSVQASGAGRPSFTGAEALPNGDVREQRLCTAIRGYWSARGYYGVAMAVEAVRAAALPTKTQQQRLYVIRSNLTAGMPPEMGRAWRPPTHHSAEATMNQGDAA